MKTRIIITGMHRSGTSMLSGVMGIIGLEIGRNFRKTPKEDNPRGYFEDLQFMGINKRLMKEAGIGPGSFNIPKKYKMRITPAIQNQIVEFLFDWDKMDFPQGWKDPRACLTLGIWRQVIKDLKVLVIERPRIEILNSLKTRNKTFKKADSVGFPTQKMLNVIDHYLSRLDFFCKGLPTLRVKHHDFYAPSKLPGLISELMEFADIENTVDFESVTDFIDKNLWRERQSLMDKERFC